MNKVDYLVGQRIRARRLELGKSQTDLGDAVGVKFQQIQKYETGTNRVSASRLFAIADVLQVPVEYFFADSLNDPDGEDGEETRPLAEILDEDRRARQLLLHFNRLFAPQKDAVLSMVISMAQAIETRGSTSGAESRIDNLDATRAGETKIGADRP